MMLKCILDNAALLLHLQDSEVRRGSALHSGRAWRFLSQRPAPVYKYQNQFHLISDEDKPYYNKTITEIISRKIKRFYKNYIYDKKKKK